MLVPSVGRPRFWAPARGFTGVQQICPGVAEIGALYEERALEAALESTALVQLFAFFYGASK